MLKVYLADRDCQACGYGVSLRRAKADSCEVSYETTEPGTITMRCLKCGNVRVLTMPKEAA
jgi:hypothetical protein